MKFVFINSIAFLEFKNEAVASKIRKRKQGAKIQDRLLIIDPVGVARKSDDKNVDDKNVDTKNVNTKPTKKTKKGNYCGVPEMSFKFYFFFASS